jgi:2-hydroxychromene-2-carboxylate isomerase
MTKPNLEFWFEFASTYSYLSVMRLPGLAQEAGVDVIWRPFLLGPIFADQGWSTSPFNLYPAKGRYMWRDMQHRTATLGLPLQRPDPFPQNSLLAARVAQLALTQPGGDGFCQAVFRAEFGDGRDISDPTVIADCLARNGLPHSLVEAAQSPANKQALKTATETAKANGIFGAPSFLVGSELFWGDDRLEEAIAWALHPTPARQGGRDG